MRKDYKKSSIYFANSKKSSTFARLFPRKCNHEPHIPAVEMSTKTTRMADVQQHIIQLDALSLGEHRIDFQLNDTFFHSIEKSEVLGGEVEVAARLNLREEDFDLQISVDGAVQVTCDRCLDPMDIPVHAQESEWDWDETPVQTIDLSWLAYELIIVNLPIVHSHQPGGCNPQMAALLQDHLCTSLEDNNTDGENAEI